jgi:uncharacterized protein YndB with AHSA1/START domain
VAAQGSRTPKEVYREIVEPERIVYVNSFSDAEGNTVERMPESLVTLTFIEHEGKTKLINHTQFASPEAFNMGHTVTNAKKYRDCRNYVYELFYESIEDK